MSISPYFRNLRSAYSAELDDLAFDSEGAHILDRRLVQRRKEMEFLVHMMEISPEMVAVVFHKGFRFKSMAAMDDVLSREPEDLPEWDSLADCIEMAPWTAPLVAIVQKQSVGDWFLTVAAALEYMHTQPGAAHAGARREADGDDHEQEHDTLEQGDSKHREEEENRRSGKRPVAHADDDHEDHGDDRGLDEAGADWMAEHGFDRKD